MAINYTRFSFTVPLPNQAAVDYALELAQRIVKYREDTQDEPLDKSFPEDLQQLDSWWIKVQQDESEDTALSITDDESGVDAACQFVQHLLSHFEIDEPVAFSWANTCNRPIVGCFGGGAAFITRHMVDSMDTLRWMLDKQEAWKKRREESHECDECGHVIPDHDGGGLDNRFHAESCSLFTPEKS